MKKEDSICESCGNVGEIGYIIGQGDEIAEILIVGDEKFAELRLNDYLDIAKTINKDFKYNKSYNTETNTLVVNVEFEVSAEKLIFELKTRHLNK